MKELLRRDFLKLTVSTATVLCSGISLFANSTDNSNIAVVMYHDINPHAKDPYTVTPIEFASQMEWLYQEGFQTLFLDEVEEFIRHGGQKGIVLTFDDGYFSFLSYAYPFLSRYQFKATINVIGESVGAWTTFGRNRPMLSWDEYRYLLGEGKVQLGCHTYGIHQGPSGIFKVADSKIAEDLSRFQATMKHETGQTSFVLAWPFGDYRQRYVDIAKDVGFEYFLTSNEEYWNRTKNGNEAIPRLFISQKLDLISYRQYIRRNNHDE